MARVAFKKNKKPTATTDAQMIKGEKKFAVYKWKVLRMAGKINYLLRAKSINLLEDVITNVLEHLFDTAVHEMKVNKRDRIYSGEITTAIEDMKITLEDHEAKMKIKNKENADNQNVQDEVEDDIIVISD